MSMRLLPLLARPFPATAFMTFSTWAVVAGTYGRQTFRKAGVTKGRQIRLNAMAEPPEKNNRSYLPKVCGRRNEVDIF